MNPRTCRRCKKAKAPSAFRREPSTCRLSKVCTRCSNEVRILRAGVLDCRLCGDTKPLEEMCKHPTAPAGRDRRCKACRAESQVRERRATAVAVASRTVERMAFDDYAAPRNFTAEEMTVIRQLSQRMGLRNPSPLDLSEAYASRAGIDQARECSLLSAASLLAQ